MFRKVPSAQVRRFAGNETGAVAMLFGLILLMLSVCAGAALDISRSVTARGKLSGALDAAILAVARGMTLGTLKEEGIEDELNRMFAANVKSGFLEEFEPTIKSIRFDRAHSTIEASAAAVVPAALIQLAGVDKMDVGVSSSASFNNDRVEIAMMLDVTGSMAANHKIGAMKSAATLAIDTFLPPGGRADPEKVRIALVPYSQGVNAGGYARAATGNVSGKCATERAGKYAFSNVSPKHAAIGNGSDKCPSAAILPLEFDAGTLKREISRFRAGGYTSGNVGIAWTWYMLSQQWNGLWPKDSAAQPKTADNVHKYAILMTDGEFNTVYDKQADGSYSEVDLKHGGVAKSNARAVDLCKAMKADGIVVFTIAFDLRTKSAINTLNACKSDDVSYQTFYSAASEAELKAAYLDIASLIQSMWLSK